MGDTILPAMRHAIQRQKAFDSFSLEIFEDPLFVTRDGLCRIPAVIKLFEALLGGGGLRTDLVCGRQCVSIPRVSIVVVYLHLTGRYIASPCHLQGSCDLTRVSLLKGACLS
jgi:hypothetical protein